MLKIQLLIKFIIACFFLSIGKTSPIHAQSKAYISYCSFNSPQIGPYIELYLSVNGKLLKFNQQNNERHLAKVEVSINIHGHQNNFYNDKYILHHELADSIIPDHLSIFDLQRIPLTNGNYDANVIIKDLNNASILLDDSLNIKVQYDAASINISDIELIESYSKTDKESKISKVGYDLLPYLSDFFPKSMNTLSFYGEIYHSNLSLTEGNKFIANYYIENADKGHHEEQFFRFKRMDTSQVNIIFNSFNIEKLASGNYHLVIEVKNKENKSVAVKKLFFQRSNPQSDSLLYSQLSDISFSFVSNITHPDSLTEYIKSLYPISNDYEKKYAMNQIALKDVKLMQQYFLYFWQKRNALDPEPAWKNYYAEVLRVNNDFGSNLRKGYETDRGRVYLQYGPPNQRTKIDYEPNAYPYEIWHYYKLSEAQSNKKFVFYNPDLVTNEYELIHSDARGEKYNSQWNILLHKRHTTITDPDENSEKDYYGSKSLEYYQSPR
jgi:GWxTD domain-containing protein